MSRTIELKTRNTKIRKNEQFDTDLEKKYDFLKSTQDVIEKKYDFLKESGKKNEYTDIKSNDNILIEKRTVKSILTLERKIKEENKIGDAIDKKILGSLDVQESVEIKIEDVAHILIDEISVNDVLIDGQTINTIEEKYGTSQRIRDAVYRMITRNKTRLVALAVISLITVIIASSAFSTSAFLLGQFFASIGFSPMLIAKLIAMKLITKVGTSGILLAGKKYSGVNGKMSKNLRNEIFSGKMKKILRRVGIENLSESTYEDIVVSLITNTSELVSGGGYSYAFNKSILLGTVVAGKVKNTTITGARVTRDMLSRQLNKISTSIKKIPKILVKKIEKVEKIDEKEVVTLVRETVLNLTETKKMKEMKEMKEMKTNKVV